MASEGIQEIAVTDDSTWVRDKGRHLSWRLGVSRGFETPEN